MRLFRSWSACKMTLPPRPPLPPLGPPLVHVSLAMERDAAFAAVPRLRVNFYFVNEHV